MKDRRIEKWADILLTYSLNAQRGESLFIQAEVAALPLVEAAYERALSLGVHVEYSLYSEKFQELFFQHASDEILQKTQSQKMHAVSTFDMLLFVYAPHNAKALSHVDPYKLGLASQAHGPVQECVIQRTAEKRVRWCRTHMPTVTAAQLCGMGTYEYEEYVYRACHLNEENPIKFWQELTQMQDRFIHYLEEKKELRFVTNNGTDLTVNIEGMRWQNCSGKINFPDGEIFTGPNLKAADGGVNGVVRYSFPTIYKGVEVEGIELVFEKGAVVQARASKNEKFLHVMLEQDEGAKFVGEIAIGTNNNIQTASQDILFDEKIGGTFHTAVGAGYPQTGNTNSSALHWDMICDLREGGTIWADGECFFQDHAFLIPS